ncbi:MAG TPA: indole-3-glycerol phosphate synthase TrpC, partial [Candidatus Baltobacteraceae bacterium]|nr:indole-3-glycerol phosphate synthase TrpC [Candidatus Baltobacteraceae bacterium]
MADTLQKIYAAKAVQLKEEEASEPYETVRARALERKAQRRHFLAALRAADGPGFIAEIKRASPSAGLISRNFDPPAIARVYQSAGVDAISVLTERDHFLGDIAYLDQVRAVVTRPILRKDFLSTRYHVAQSAAYGADCILLIVGGMDDDALNGCMDEARQYDLDVLVEVHDENDLDRAVAAGAGFVGV